jgi:hypothetical protein
MTTFENSLNESLVESENKTGLKKETVENVPRMDNADEANVIVEVCENAHKPKTTYANIVKRNDERINNPSSHSLKLIQ